MCTVLANIYRIKIGNGTIWSDLIRFPPAETAIMFLSLRFSCGSVALPKSTHTKPGGFVQKSGIHMCDMYSSDNKGGIESGEEEAQHGVTQI